MKTKYIMAVIGSLWACIAQAQDNLVPNGGFEEGKTPQCAEVYSLSEKNRVKARQAFDTDLSYWKRARPSKYTFERISPDYLDSAARCKESNCTGLPRYTARYVGMGAKEGIRNSLTEPLQPGKTYYARFLFRDQSGSGARVIISVLSEHWYQETGNDHFQFGRIQDISPKAPNCMWQIAQMKLSIPPGKTGLQNLIFTSSNGYFSIDDVELFEACPDTMHIQNRRYHPLPFPEPEEAGYIRAGYRVTHARTLGDVIVQKGTAIKYKGAEQVTLEDGFYVEKGGDFHAYIAPCGMRCLPFNINRDLDTVICMNTPFVITGDPSPNSTYTWDAVNPLHLKYLENVNTCAPMFSPPSSGIGFIQYTLKVTNICGEVYYRNVHIKYNMMGSTAPSFAVLDSTLSDTLAFTLKLHPQTENVKIELLSCTNPPAVLQEYEYTAFENFTTDTFRWELPDGVNLCQCYNVRISSKNFCNSQWCSRTISWPLQPRSNYSINLPNVISSTDGCQYCFTVTGAQSYKMIVVTRAGQHVFEENQPIYGQEVCTWYAGGMPFGEYFATLEVVDCNGITHKYVFTILVACNSEMVGSYKNNDLPSAYIRPAYTSQLSIAPTTLATYPAPNPINQNSEIIYHLPEPGKVTLRIFDRDMRLVEVIEQQQLRESGIFHVKFDAQRLPYGVNYYHFEFINAQGEYQSRYIRLLK